MNKALAVTLLKRLVLAAVMEGPLFVLAAFGIFGASFAGKTFYVLLFEIAYVIAAVSIAAFIFISKIRKYAKRFYLVFSVLFFIPIGVRETYYHFDNKVTVLSDGVDIMKYKPFSDTLPRLPGKSSLQIQENMPVLDGALALYPVYAAFATAVYPKADYLLENHWVPSGGREAYYAGDKHAVHFTNTASAFDALLRGRVDIYFMGKISDAQMDEAKKKNIDLVFTPIGREAFVFFVNKDNPVNGLTVEQIKGIYSGRITRWEDLGGAGKIRPFQRQKNSGSQSALEHLMNGEKLIDPPTTEKPTGMGGIIRQVSDYKNYAGSIGYSFRFFATAMAKNDEIKLLKINGISPTEENIENETYPLASEFYAITRKDEKNTNVSKMLKWMTSDEGQYLVEKTGYVPVKRTSSSPKGK